jgi:hypothetical protein
VKVRLGQSGGRRGVAPGESITRRARSKGDGFGGAGCLALFFFVFLAAGVAGSWFFGRAALGIVTSRSWAEVPCTLLESAVLTHSGDDSDTYSVQVRYTYVYEGREYQGDRLRFLGGSSSGRRGKEEWVAAHPAGSRTVCWVNPESPAEAVLDRGFSPVYLAGLIPLLFAAVGLGGIVFALRVWSKERALRAGLLPGVTPGASVGHVGHAGHAALGGGGGVVTVGALGRAGALPGQGAITLEPQMGPVGKLVGTVFVALFWNGITGVFLWKVVDDWRSGQPDGCLTAFLVPFVLIGLMLLISVPYQLLALFNPRPVLVLDRGLRLGEPVRLSWRFRGAAGRIRRLRLTLSGREEATYRRGTSTHTDRSTFTEISLLDLTDRAALREGSVQVTVPADTMHTFTAAHNKVVWSLKIQGEIARWPDVGEDFEVTVSAGAPGSGGWR